MRKLLKRWKKVKRKEVEMQNKDWYWETSQMKKKLERIEASVDEVKAVVKPGQELWDGSDIIRFWKVSSRTLADWRAKGLIGFIQVGNKIWYPRDARELFLSKYFNKAKGDKNGEEL